jgi:membrane protease YdiL (CAAX protease family)
MNNASIQRPADKRPFILIGAGIPLLYQTLLTLLAFLAPETILPPAGWVSLHLLTGVLFTGCPVLAVRLAGVSLGEAWRAIGGRRVSLLDGSLAFLVGLLAILPIQWAYNIVAYWLFGLSPAFGFSQSARDLVPFLVLVLVVGPVGEETFFRGYLGSLGWKPWVFIVGSSLLWSAMHLDPLAFLPLLWTGIVFALLRRRLHSFLPSLLLHVSINALALLLHFLVT